VLCSDTIQSNFFYFLVSDTMFDIMHMTKTPFYNPLKRITALSRLGLSAQVY